MALTPGNIAFTAFNADRFDNATTLLGDLIANPVAVRRFKRAA